MTGNWTRRELLGLLGGAAGLSLGTGDTEQNEAAARSRLYFDRDQIPSIRANAGSPFLRPTLENWRSEDVGNVRRIIRRPLETGDLLGDFGTSVTTTVEQTLVYLITNETVHRELVLLGLETLVELPKWDYLLDGGVKSLGLMRASKAVNVALFALEVLGDTLDEPARQQILQNVAEKGCEPCHVTIAQMNDPARAEGWGVDRRQKELGHPDWNMSNWPTILGQNNLRAIPTMGLGLGALALMEIDDRAPRWLDAAEDSARRFLKLLSDDGSYFEGISYIDFALRTLLLFLEAHYRVRGDIDWVDEANFYGVTNFIAVMQNGRSADGTPDVVNISDSRQTVFACVPSWIRRRARDPLAAHAATKFSRPGYFADFLWYDPEDVGSPPPDQLKNTCLNLDWIVTRTGWDSDDTIVSFRSGPPTNHEHADRNHISIKARGERLLTDHFGAAYDPRQPEWLLRLPEAHNTVLIDGRGHQYHNGEQGTNEGEAHATIIRYLDRGDQVSWTSDATQGYNLVNSEIGLVLRSVLFVKPDLVILVDRVEMDSGEGRVSVLFHPDNRDGMAEIETVTKGFVITRNDARLSAAIGTSAPVDIEAGTLVLPAESGIFPQVRIDAEPAGQTIIVSVLALGGLDIRRPLLEMVGPHVWRLHSRDESIQISAKRHIPVFDRG